MNAVGQADCIFRSAPGRAYPESWKETSDRLRFGALQRSDANTLMPKHHLLHGIRSVRSVVCMTCADYQAVWRVVCPEIDSVPNPEFLRALGVESILAPHRDYALDSDPFPAGVETNLVRFGNERAFPRAWLVSDWKLMQADPPADWRSLLTRTRDVWLRRDGSIVDLRRQAIIESDLAIPEPGTRDAVFEQPTLTLDRPEHIRIDCKPTSPAILVLRDQFYPGWEASVGSSVDTLRRADLLRVNRVMRGVYLESSDRVVEFRYRPESVFWGATISLLAWCGVIVVLWKTRRCPRSCN